MRSPGAAEGVAAGADAEEVVVVGAVAAAPWEEARCAAAAVAGQANQ